MPSPAVRAVRVPLGRELAIVIWVPDRETATTSARRVLPEQVAFDDAVFNVGRTALLVAALAAGEVEAIRTATEDRLHQDRRLARARDTHQRDRGRRSPPGAYAAWLSGSGPSAAAFVDPNRARRNDRGGPSVRWPCRAYSTIDDDGVTVTEGERPMKVQDRCVVVTGAASGIGATLARRFHAEGRRRVVVADRAGGGARRASPVRSAAMCLAVPCDVTDEQQIRALVEAADVRSFGPVDLFCSNAGVIAPADEEATDDEWRLSIDVNVMAHVYAARAVVPSMLERGEWLSPADGIGRGSAHPDRLARRTRSRSTPRSRSPSGSRSPTATTASRCRCSRRKPCAPQ